MDHNGTNQFVTQIRFDSCYTFDAFRSLADQWKADIVRIAMYVNEQGYNTNPSYWKGRVAQMIDWAGQVGIYVLIDWHTLTPGDPNDGSYNEKWDFWGYISSKYAGQAHVLYEICNEPNGVNWGQIENYANPLIKMIRDKDPDTIVIVGTPTWSQELWNVNPLPYKNIMYTLHFYASSHYFQDLVKQ
jgi:aryl-phospho-beta-D-glucosidase BglC (GH1 family)